MQVTDRSMRCCLGFFVVVVGVVFGEFGVLGGAFLSSSCLFLIDVINLCMYVITHVCPVGCLE